MTSAPITFEILLRAPGTGGEPDVSTIEQFRPAAEDIIRCQRWFAAHGVEAQSTGFGLLCNAPRTLFESMFGVTLTPVPPEPSAPAFTMSGKPRPPKEVAPYIEQVTLAVPPEYF